jgi:hypothetical protein
MPNDTLEASLIHRDETVSGIIGQRVVLALSQTKIGRNAAAGEAIKIPAKTVVKITITKAAKESIVPEREYGTGRWYFYFLLLGRASPARKWLP